MSDGEENQLQRKKEKELTPKSETGGAMTTAEEQSNLILEISSTKIHVPLKVIIYKKDSFFQVEADAGY